MINESSTPKDRPDVLNLEFIKILRRKIADRLEKDYPTPPREDYKAFLDDLRNGDTRMYIDSWVGDVFAHVVKEYGLNEEEYDKLRKALFVD